MIGEIDIYGVFIPPLLVWVCAALPLTAVLRRLLRWLGVYRLVWHPPLVRLALFVCLFSGLVLLTRP